VIFGAVAIIRAATLGALTIFADLALFAIAVIGTIFAQAVFADLAVCTIIINTTGTVSTVPVDADFAFAAITVFGALCNARSVFTNFSVTAVGVGAATNAISV